MRQEGDKKRVVIRRNAGSIVVAAALGALFVLAFVLALAQDKLSLLVLGLTEHLFGIVLAVFVLERTLAWREERRWLTAKNWLYLLLLETIDDLLKQLLPATVTPEAVGTSEKVIVSSVSPPPVVSITLNSAMRYISIPYIRHIYAEFGG